MLCNFWCGLCVVCILIYMNKRIDHTYTFSHTTCDELTCRFLLLKLIFCSSSLQILIYAYQSFRETCRIISIIRKFFMLKKYFCSYKWFIRYSGSNFTKNNNKKSRILQDCHCHTWGQGRIKLYVLDLF